MPFNGAGVFTRVRNWVADATAGIKIRADYHDAEDDNFAAGITNCIARDGQSQITQNIPFNSKRITGLADPINAQDAVTKTYADTKLAAGGGSMTGLITTAGSSPGIAAAGGSQALMVMGAGDTNEAFMTFHRPAQFALNFGLGANGNLWFGGFSHGAGIQYQLWSTRDFNYIPVNKAGDTVNGALTVTGALSSSSNISAAGAITAGGSVSGVNAIASAGDLYARNNSGNPSVYLQDVNGTSRSQIFYNRANNSLDLFGPATTSLSLPGTGKLRASNGIQSKYGFGGGYGTVCYNLWWEGGVGMHLFADDIRLGVIAVSTTTSTALEEKLATLQARIEALESRGA